MLVRTPWGRWLDCVGGYVERWEGSDAGQRKFEYFATLYGQTERDKQVLLDKVPYKTEQEAQAVLDKFFYEILKEEKANG